MALSSNTNSDTKNRQEDINIQLQSVVGYNISSQGGSVFSADGGPYYLTSTQPTAGGVGSIPTDEITVDSVIAPFGTANNKTDVVELHVYNPIDELLESSYSIPYRANKGLRGGGNRDINSVDIDLHTVFRDLGYISGKFKFQLNFHRNVLGTESSRITLTSISPDRTEVTVTYAGVGIIDSEPVIDYYGNRLDYYLNAGDNKLYKIGVTRYNTELSTNTENVYVLTLIEPLPAEFGLGDTFWVDLQVADPQTDTIIIFPGPGQEEYNDLRGPNYNVEVRVAQSTAFKSWNDILGSNPTSSQQLINKFISSSFDVIDLPIDYRDYSNFVFYGSARERLENFRYKLRLVEYYQGLLDASSNVANPYISTNKNDISNKLNTLLSGFDGYEKYLYYESSSYESSSYGEFNPTTWPKTNSSRPYSLYPVTSSEAQTWFSGQLESASFYDIQNYNNLLKLIPEHILEDRYNETYVTFVNMIGQHFDILWAYVNHLSKISSREESLNFGLAKDLVYHVLKSHGLDSAHGFKLEELWFDSLGLDANGNYRQTGSLQSIPSSDISKETFKRILNNLPYLLKTKGTKRGIRALLNCYGVPSTVYRVKEFSGPYQYKSDVYDNDAVYRKVEKFTLAAYLGNGESVIAPGGGSTRMFRFKPASTASFTIDGVTLTYDTALDDGVTGDLNGTTGPWYNGYWITVTDQGYVFQVINGRVIDYPISVTVGTSFGSCDAYIQEIKGFSTALPVEVLREHARNPQSLIGTNTVDVYANPSWQLSDAYDYTSARTQLTFRIPLGTTLQTYYGSTSIPSITPSNAGGSATISGFTSASWVGNVEDYYVWYPNLADNLDIAEKIRIESSSISGSLSSEYSIEKNQFDFYSLDSPKLGVYFSPQDEINEDIADQFSGISMDNLIGDPRYDRMTKYPELEKLSRHYHLKYNGDNIFWKYIKLVENFDASMFYLVKKFLPARAVKMVGLVIQPTILERAKIPQIGELEIEQNTYELNYDLTDYVNLLGENNSYDAVIDDLTIDVVQGENNTYESDMHIFSPANIMCEYDTYEASAVAVHGALSSNVDVVMDQAGLPFTPTAIYNHTYGGCKISSRAFNIPSDDTFDGAPVVEFWTTSPNSPINSSGQSGGLAMANSPNVTGGKFNAVFPNGLVPGVILPGQGGRVVTNFMNPISFNRMMGGGPTIAPPIGPLGGRAVSNFTDPTGLGGRVLTNFTDNGALGGRAVTNVFDTGPLGARGVTNVFDTGPLGGRVVTNYMDPTALEGRGVSNFNDPTALG